MNFNQYKTMPIAEIGELERAKKGKIYRAGSTLIQLSATQGQLEYLKQCGAVETKYAVLTPDSRYNARYIYTSIQRAMPKFLHKQKTGINIQFDALKKMKIAVHDRETQDYIAMQDTTIDDAIEKEQMAIHLAKDIKKYFLEGMFV